MGQEHFLQPITAVLRVLTIDGDTVKHERPAPFQHVLPAGIASIITMGVALGLLDLDQVPYLLASLGGSCVILFAIPDSVMAQPRSFIGGHFVGTTVGLIFSHAFGVGIFTMACAVGTAIALMMVTDTIHSPAGADPLIVMAAHPGWSFLAAPLALGLVILFVGASLYHRLILRRVYPVRWL
jgi:CBS-domain-containing membrane protein